METWIKELMDLVKEEMKKEGIEGDTTIQMVKKSNDRELHCLTIKSTLGQMAPVMYLDELWELYQDGMTTKDLAKHILLDYATHRDKEKDFTSTIEDKEQLMKALRVRMVDARCNENYLKNCVHRTVESDLALIAEIHFDTPEQFGYYSSIVTLDLAESHDLDTEELMDRAIQNARNEEGESLFILASNLFTERPKNVLNAKLDKKDIFILSNHLQMSGAHVIVTRPDVMESIRKKIGDFWIIPSSRHEVLLMSKERGLMPEQLLEMLHEANRQVVSDDDFLSDDIFEYTEKGLARYDI
jgi:hypothetical protein